MNVLEKQKIIVETFSSLMSWEDRYSYIISLGHLCFIEESSKTDVHALAGCAARSYFIVERRVDKIFLQAHSESKITLGIMAVLTFVYDNQSLLDVKDSDSSFLYSTGLHLYLTPSRGSALNYLIAKIYGVTEIIKQ